MNAKLLFDWNFTAHAPVIAHTAVAHGPILPHAPLGLGHPGAYGKTTFRALHV